MPRGAPDYLIPPSVIRSIDFDPTSMIGSLGGVQSVDGRGRVQFATDFKGGLSQFTLSALAPASAPKVTSLRGENGYFSALFDAGATANSGFSIMERQIRIDGGNRAGFETGFTYLVSRPDVYMEFKMATTDIKIEGGVKIGWDDKLYLRDDNGTFTQIDTLTPVGQNNVWVSVKLVLDVSAGEYVRLIVGQREYDISGYPIEANLLPNQEFLYTEFYVQSQGAARRNMYLGHYIITVDEP